MDDNILDSTEISTSISKGNDIGKIIGVGFFLSLPLIFYLFVSADDHGLFIPRTELIDTLLPKWLIYLKDDYEIRCAEEIITTWIFFYFIILGFLNVLFWRNNHKRKLRIGHAIITIGLAIIYLETMIEFDIFHDLKIRDPIGKQQYGIKVGIFYQLLLVWILTQIIYLIVFLEDNFFIKNKRL